MTGTANASDVKGGSSGEGTSRVIDSTDYQNFAIDRQPRSSRNDAPMYKFPPLNRKKVTEADGSIRGTRTKVGRVAKSKARPKRLTPRRLRVILDFLKVELAQPGQYGPVGGDRWKNKLVQLLQMPPSICHFDPVTSQDINRWLQSVQFAEILQQLSQRGIASSSSSTTVATTTNLQPSTEALNSMTNSTTVQQQTSSSGSGSASSVSGFSSLALGNPPSLSSFSSFGDDDVTSLVPPRMEMELAVYSTNSNGTQQCQRFPMYSVTSKRPMPPLKYYGREENIRHPLDGFRGSIGKYPESSESSQGNHEPRFVKDSALNQILPAFISTPIPGTSYQQQQLSRADNKEQLFHRRPPEHTASQPQPSDNDEYQIPSVATALRTLRGHSKEMVRTFNDLEEMGYNQVNLTIFGHQLNALISQLYFTMAIPEENAAPWHQEQQ